MARRQPRRRTDEHSGDPLPLLDDRHGGLRVYLVRVPRRGSAAPHMTHKGVELVTVAGGLVQVVLDTGRPVLTAGEALLLDGTPIVAWRNLGAGEATLFWTLRDPRRDS